MAVAVAEAGSSAGTTIRTKVSTTFESNCLVSTVAVSILYKEPLVGTLAVPIGAVTLRPNRKSQ